MINLLVSEFTNYRFFFTVLFMLSIYLLIITNWLNIKSFLQLKNYDAVQRVHMGEVPRFGGLISWLGILIYCFLSWAQHDMNLIFCILVTSIPLCSVALIEDVFHNTGSYLRLASMFLSAFLFFYFSNISYPQIEFPFLGDFLQSSGVISILFFTFSVVVIINGCNLIDGANGLLPFTYITQCLCLILICYQNQDIDNLAIILFFITPMILFVFFNYPFGKIFLGDFGAYFFGFIISILVVVVFSHNPNVPTWYAVLILFYPAFELLFSILRKIISFKNPLSPDILHLHIKIFYFFLKKIKHNQISNSLVTPFLFFIWGIPFIFLFFTDNSMKLAIYGIILQIMIYIIIYILIPKPFKISENNYD